MKADTVKIAEGVYWIGVLDWDIRDYHGYTLNGTTYNAFLVFGENEVALIDNTYPGSSAQLWGRIEDAFNQENREVKVDVIIQNVGNSNSIGRKIGVPRSWAVLQQLYRYGSRRCLTFVKCRSTSTASSSKFQGTR